MYIFLNINKPKFVFDREIYVEIDYREGGDGYHEQQWREFDKLDVYKADWQYSDGFGFYTIGDKINDIIQRANDIYNFDLWGYIADRIAEKLS